MWSFTSQTWIQPPPSVQDCTQHRMTLNYSCDCCLLLCFPSLFSISETLLFHPVILYCINISLKDFCFFTVFSWILFLLLEECSCKSAQLCWTALELPEGKESSWRGENTVARDRQGLLWWNHEEVERSWIGICAFTGLLPSPHTRNCREQSLPRSGSTEGHRDGAGGWKEHSLCMRSWPLVHLLLSSDSTSTAL